MNTCALSGNITRDPDYKVTSSGTQILAFGIAVNGRVRNQQTGEWEDRPDFFEVTVFGNRAEALSRILSKGMKVALSGRLHYSSWDDKDTGKKRSKVDVIANDVDIMTRRQDGEAQQTARQAAAPPESRPEARRAADDYLSDDIPF